MRCLSVLAFLNVNLGVYYKLDFETNLIFFLSLNLIFTAYVAYKNQFRNQIDFLTWYFKIEKKSSDTWYFKNQVEIDRGYDSFVLQAGWAKLCMKPIFGHKVGIKTSSFLWKVCFSKMLFTGVNQPPRKPGNMNYFFFFFCFFIYVSHQ